MTLTDVLIDGVDDQFDDTHKYELHISRFTEKSTHGYQWSCHCNVGTEQTRNCTICKSVDIARVIKFILLYLCRETRGRE